MPLHPRNLSVEEILDNLPPEIVEPLQEALDLAQAEKIEHEEFAQAWFDAYRDRANKADNLFCYLRGVYVKEYSETWSPGLENGLRETLSKLQGLAMIK
jgi:hypothetical protein